MNRFPIDVELKQKWCNVISKANSSVCKGVGLICEKHFPEDAFERNRSNKITGIRKNSIPCYTNQHSNETTAHNESSIPEFDSNSNETQLCNPNQIHQECFRKIIEKDLEIYKLKETIESLQNSKKQCIKTINTLKKENKDLRENITELEKTNENFKDIFMKSRDHQDSNKVNISFLLLLLLHVNQKKKKMFVFLTVSINLNEN